MHSLRRQEGVTLIEVLVVSLVLSLLAAIGVPGFFSQREKGSDAQAKAQVRTAETAIETYATEHGGEYEGATVADLTAIEPALDADVLAIVSAAPDSYELTATSSSGNVFTIRRDSSGVVELTCDEAARGGCPADRDWGR